MRALFSIWTWFLILFFSTVSCILQAPFLLTLPFAPRRWLMGRIFRWMAICVATLTPMWRFGVHKPLAPYRPRKTVVVSNHASHTDAFLISHLPWEMKWLGKKILFKIPIMGWAMWLSGDIGLVRGNKESAIAAMKVCARYLEMGMPIMIFPEGTRSKTGEMGPFKDGAFRLAIDTGAEILPIAVSGTTKALTKNDWRFGWAKARVTMGEPIPTEGLTLDDMQDLKDKTREAIQNLRRELAPLTSEGSVG